LQQVQLADFLSEFLLLLFLLVKQFLVPLVVSIHFLFVFSLLDAELFLVQTSQVFDLLHALLLDLVLFSLNHAILLVVVRLLVPDLGFQLLDFVLVCSQLILGLLLMRVLVHLDIVLQSLDV
jgi:hypothetical protein